MSTINAKNYSSPKNVNLKEGILRFGGTFSATPFDSTSNGLYVNSSNALIYYAQGVSTTIGSAGAGGTPSWETLYTNDSTFNVLSGGWTIAGGSDSATDVVTLTASAGTSGDVIQITNSGTGNDIQGTSNTWNVTKLGVATFAGISISGTTTALTFTGNATVTLNDNSATALSIGSSGATTQLVFDTSNGAEVITATIRGVSIVANSNTIQSLLVTNNTITTFGANADAAGMVVIRSTSATSGALLQLQSTEATMTTGFYLVARSVGVGNKFTIAAGGVTVIAGVAASNSFTLTAGDQVLSDGSITITDADNAATLDVINNTATTASVARFSSTTGVFSGTTTSAYFYISHSGLTTGTLLGMSATATTSVAVVDLALPSMTSGSGLRITGATANFTTGGKLIELTSTAAVAGNFITATTTGIYTGTGLIVLSVGAFTTGIGGLSVVNTGTAAATTGSQIRTSINGTAAISTNGIISFTHTGAFTSTSAVDGGFVEIKANSTTAGTVVNVVSSGITTGIGVQLSNGTSAITSGSLLRVTTSGVGTIATNGIVSITHAGIFVSTANAGVLDVQASALVGAGTVVNFKATAASQTAANVLNVVQSGATITAYTASVANFTGGFAGSSSTGSVILLTTVNDTAGNGLKIVANALTVGAATGILVSHTTSVLGAGTSLLRLSSTGVNTGSTTGILLDLASTAHTTATLAMITDSSADTSARIGFLSKVTNAAAILAVPIKSSNIAVVSTHWYRHIVVTNGTQTNVIWQGDGTTSPNTALTGTAGDIAINNDSSKAYYCTGTTNWTAM